MSDEALYVQYVNASLAKGLSRKPRVTFDDRDECMRLAIGLLAAVPELEMPKPETEQ
jgi:hypothetical protein